MNVSDHRIFMHRCQGQVTWLYHDALHELWNLSVHFTILYWHTVMVGGALPKFNGRLKTLEE